MTKIGIFNPNSRHRDRRRDEDLSSTHPLSERELLIIHIETAQTVIASIPATGFEKFAEKVKIQLADAKKALADYDGLPETCNHTEGYSTVNGGLKCANCKKIFQPRDNSELLAIVQRSGGQREVGGRGTWNTYEVENMPGDNRP